MNNHNQQGSPLSDTKIAKIIVNSEEGYSDKRNAEMNGVDRKTVRKYSRIPLQLLSAHTQELILHFRKTEIDNLTIICAKALKRIHELLDSGDSTMIPTLAVYDRALNARQLLGSRPQVINAWEEAQKLKVQMARLEEIGEMLDETRIARGES
jgi:hypothetical protein